MEKIEPELRLFDSSEELSSGLADYVLQVAESAVKDIGSFSLVLSGGDIPKRLGKLTKAPFLRLVDWPKWHVFWAEENVVAKLHPDSLYWQAKECFISKVPLLPAHIISVSHGVEGESAASSYEFSIRQQVKKRTVQASPSSDCPRFDLVLLSLGPNGHVASLYPNDPVLQEESQWVACVSKDGTIESVTLTLPVINAAANVAIVAAGMDLARPFMDVMVSRKPIGSHPAQMVSPQDGKLVWFVDASAASLFLRGNEHR
ncbi:PREDICTED: probable 6-phosphogluconolactonase 2 [Theobroma cacao]|uniref:Probable 6-phosphogluconolactonase n=1 Tax=Theobroma cacao TaxID=3641 RepID=A0AB32UV54_THECC|nr:PREDICTED: probable 6-phosphogluconolactonase 2 [Theobroma cacao]